MMLIQVEMCDPHSIMTDRRILKICIRVVCLSSTPYRPHSSESVCRLTTLANLDNDEQTNNFYNDHLLFVCLSCSIYVESVMFNARRSMQ